MWPYAPALVVVIGAMIVAGGSFWQGVRQSKFNAEIRSKNDQSCNYRTKNIRTLKGSDFFHLMVVYTPNSVDQFPLFSVNSADLPVYDVYLVIRSHVDLPWDTPEHQAEALHYLQNPAQIEIGNVPYGAKQTQISLEPGYYQIDIRTRYHKYTEMLKFGPFGTGMGQSYIVNDFTDKIFTKQTSPDGFPKIYKD